MKVLDSGFFDNPDLNWPGKWLFPINLVRQWVEAGTENYPRAAQLHPTTVWFSLPAVTICCWKNADMTFP
ncbi:MAG: hypothetical protein LC657_02910 [Desulfobacteraceae bacterium]|nr:hypothetical protein [Desulfobacteraceae bacterium]